MRYRRDREKDEAKLRDAVAAQRAMHEAISARSAAFLTAAEAGWSLAEIASAVALTPQGVHKIVRAAEDEEAAGYYRPQRLRQVT